MSGLSSLSDAALAALNLARGPDGELRIAIPADANIHHMTLGRQLAAGREAEPALIFETPGGEIERWSFAEVDRAATGLAAKLRWLGYDRGDFIALHTGHRPETAIAHMAIARLGAVAVTLSQLYGPDTLAHALEDCRSGVLITAPDAWQRLRAERSAAFPHLRHILTREPQAGEIDLAEALADSGAGFRPDYGGAADPALLMYSSGSTGKPKGILHGHRVLAAYTPSINLFFNLSMDQPDAVFWSPSDWAWVGGLLDMLFPAWMAGRPVATSLDRFRADRAYAFMARHRVTHCFLAPTAIKRLAETPDPRAHHDLALRVICTGGEALAGETLEWAERALGVVCNEFYGMTEVNHLIGNCAALYPRRAGSMGRAYPGHEVHLVDEAGAPVPDGTPGEIVTRADSPTRYLGYLHAPKTEAEMRLGPWLRTRDLAVRDGDGYFWYKGRADDLIKSSGFRIGPAEIEECLIAHPSVAEAAVIGKSDAERGAIVKAIIRPAPGTAGDATLAETLKAHVRARLGGYKAPREIVFAESFPMTSSGKIDRRALRAAEEAPR